MAGLFCVLRCGHDVCNALCDGLAVVAGLPGALEGDNTIGHREQRVVLADADVLTRLDPCAALADDHLAGLDHLAVSTLHTEIFRL